MNTELTPELTPEQQSAVVEQLAHQLVTQMLFHEGLPNSWVQRFTALNEIKKAVENYKTMFAHLAMPDDYPKEASDTAKQKIMQVLGRNFVVVNKTIQ